MALSVHETSCFEAPDRKEAVLGVVIKQDVAEGSLQTSSPISLTTAPKVASEAAPDTFIKPTSQKKAISIKLVTTRWTRPVPLLVAPPVTPTPRLLGPWQSTLPTAFVHPGRLHSGGGQVRSGSPFTSPSWTLPGHAGLSSVPKPQELCPWQYAAAGSAWDVVSPTQCEVPLGCPLVFLSSILPLQA